MFTKTIFNQLRSGLTKNGNRGVKRTNALHASIVDELVKLVPNLYDKYEIIFEHRIPCAYGQKFKIDILIRDKVSKEIVVCILAKAYISSVQKNRANIANTTTGEIFRVKGIDGRNNVKVWFVTFIGNDIPVYKKDGTLRCMEKKKTAYVDFALIKNMQDNVYHSTITYDILNVDYSTKDKFNTTLQENNICNVDENSFIDKANIIFG